MERADKAAIKALLRERAVRLRELQSSGKDNEVVHLNTDLGESVKAGLEGAEESLSHVLVRTCAQGYIVKMSSLGEEGLPVNVQHKSLGVNEALDLLLDTLNEKPKMLEHRFEPRPRARSIDEMMLEQEVVVAKHQLESTTVDLWLGPRMLSAAVALRLRCCHLSEAVAVPRNTSETPIILESLKCTADNLLNKLVEVLSMSIERVDQHDNVRALLTDFLQTAVECELSKYYVCSRFETDKSLDAAVILADPLQSVGSEQPPWPIPLALTPADRRNALRKAFSDRQNVPIIAFFRNDRIPKGTQLSSRQSRPTDIGKGLANAWMPEDHTPFIPLFCRQKDTMSPTFRQIVANTLLICTIDVARRLAHRFPATLSDLGDLGNRLLSESWHYDLRGARASRPTLPSVIWACRLRTAAQSFTSESAMDIACASRSMSSAANASSWLRLVGELALQTLGQMLRDFPSDLSEVWEALGSIFQRVRLFDCSDDCRKQSAISAILEKMETQLPNLLLELTEKRARDFAAEDQMDVDGQPHPEPCHARKAAALEALLLYMQRSLPTSSILSHAQLQSLHHAIVDPDFCRGYAEQHGTLFRHPWLSEINAATFKMAREKLLATRRAQAEIASRGTDVAASHRPRRALLEAGPSLTDSPVEVADLLSDASLTTIDGFEEYWINLDESASERLTTLVAFALHPCALSKDLRRVQGKGASVKLNHHTCRMCDVVPASAAIAAASSVHRSDSELLVRRRDLVCALRLALRTLADKAPKSIVVASLEAARRTLEHAPSVPVLLAPVKAHSRKRQKRRHDSNDDTAPADDCSILTGRTVDGMLQLLCEKAVYAGLKHAHRDVRMAAGRLANTFIRKHSALRDCAQATSERVKAVLDSHASILSSPNSKLAESATISLGLIGRVNDERVSARVLEMLVLQLNSTSLSKAIAYTQLVQLSAYHKVTPYQLMAPHLANISGQIVLRMTSAPSGFLEFLNVVGQNQTTFLRATLQHTIPRIFASRERHLLSLIASAIGEDIGRMCMSVAASVLKLLLVAPNEERDAGFQLFEEVVRGSGVTATIASIARSRQGEILGFLVTRLGSDKQRQAAFNGLKWVHETLHRPMRDPLPKYLMSEVLQILAWINEELNNGHGKTSVEEKCMAARSVGALIEQLGSQVSSVAPQIMATLNSTLQNNVLMLPTLQSWNVFVTTLKFDQVGPFASQSIAAFLSAWPRFGHGEKELALNMIEYIAIDHVNHFSAFLATVPSLESIKDDPLASDLAARLGTLQNWETYPIERVAALITNENSAVCMQALRDLRSFLRNSHGRNLVESITSGSKFQPVVGKLVHALTTAAHGTDEHQTDIRDLCFECIGILGAADPDRFDPVPEDDRFVLIDNFDDDDEAANFAVHLVRDVLVSAFRAADDTMHQAGLAYAIQELLRFCGFTTALLNPNSTRTVSAKVWQRWESMPKESLETVTPLLDSRYSVQHGEPSVRMQPFYANSKDYRDWIQSWACHLILAVKGAKAKELFGIFRTLIRDHDLTIAQHILPHLVLSVLIGGTSDDRDKIRQEITQVLADRQQAGTTLSKSGYSEERRLLSAQTIFGIMDHVGIWIRDKRFRLLRDRRSFAGRNNPTLINVESVLTSIDSRLTASAALECRAYARALINYEQLIRSLRSATKESSHADGERHQRDAEMQAHLGCLHQIYAELDEPDGMEGISTLVIAPSLEHQIREHESTGRWTAAQSCWEVELQRNPWQPTFHLGLLRCLRSLGHYDTLRTHIRGALSMCPDWKSQLAPYQIEGACILSDWDEVARDVAHGEQSGEHALARVLLTARRGSAIQLEQSIIEARRHLGRPIVAAGKHSYSRIYDSIIQLHMLEEITMITSNTDPSDLHRRLSARLNMTLPSFRTREPLLSWRRSAFHAIADASPIAKKVCRDNVGRTWIQSSKLARRAGHIQSAYSAVLQSSECEDAFAVVQRAKLLVLEDQPQGAIQLLGQGLTRLKDIRPRANATEEDGFALAYDHAALVSAALLRARLVDSTSRYEANYVIARYKEAQASLKASDKPEKMYYYLGRYYDSCKEGQPHADAYPLVRARVCRQFFKSVQHGTKFFYRTLPRFLTLWFEAGEEPQVMKTRPTEADQDYIDAFNTINHTVRKGYSLIAQYQWLAMLPQLVSRIAHPNEKVFKNLQDVISYIAHTYPSQAMWGMVASAQSQTTARKQRGEKIVQHAMSSAPEATSTHVRKTMSDIKHLAKELLNLCEAPVSRDEHQLYLSKNFPKLAALAKTRPLLPISNAITVTLPSNNMPGSAHNPFPPDLPCIESFDEVIEVLSSLQKPRKLVVRATDGKTYNLLCKPKDDLRKDARLMEFDSMINKLVQRDSEARRRRLYVRTYAVVTLDEECGLIEWVPNTIGFRNILIKLYKARDIPLYTQDIKTNMDEARAKPKEAASIFEQRVLAKYPPVFHEWFLNTWPEPSAWLKARLAYARTLALMSMVGFVLGLGDRHGENILFDTVSGDTVHVDLNCIFEKGLTFEIPERVPFRLTQNFVDAMGVTGYEGVFRRSAEISLRILRENKDSLMSVLETMVHDPLVEWGSDNRSRSNKHAAKEQDPRIAEARKALDPIARKLDGMLSLSTFSKGPAAAGVNNSKVYTTNHLVDVLIREATSSSNLSQMYVGWAPYL